MEALIIALVASLPGLITAIVAIRRASSQDSKERIDGSVAVTQAAVQLLEPLEKRVIDLERKESELQRKIEELEEENRRLHRENVELREDNKKMTKRLDRHKIHFEMMNEKIVKLGGDPLEFVDGD